MSGKIRTRFAPSPTGYMHIGNLRTALYAYLLTKHEGGDFILRIEDTDQERYVDGAVDVIYKTMKDTGLIHDEGPDVGGNFGPYIQSERRGLYKEYAEKLVELGGAYYCFCDKERLDKLKEAQTAKGITPKYDGYCKGLSKEEIREKIDAGIPYVIRQRIDPHGKTTFHDEIFGDITVENAILDENVLLKSDGLPTYNFANVVDDHLMNITHVIRGNEYLSSTPKYNLIYEAFGWEIPKYIHVSPVMKNSGKKLSKRDGDASYEDFINKGYLKEAIVNYVALLGWSPGGEQEIFTMEELIKNFSVSGISKSPAIFDEKKLSWMNGEYIRKMSEEDFAKEAMPYIKAAVKREDVDFKAVCALLHARVEKFTDIADQLTFIDELPEYDNELYTHKKMKTNPENSLESLKAILPVLEGIEEWTMDNIHNALFALIEKLEVKNGIILWPLRVAVSGLPFTPGGGVDLAAILGKDETIARVKKGIEKLS